LVGGVRPRRIKNNKITDWANAMVFKCIERAIARKTPKKTLEQIRAEVVARQDAVGHAVAQRYTRGNVNIQLGAFLTKEDLAARHKK
jgi:hypothetical protein